jgi:hypothetical protein
MIRTISSRLTAHFRPDGSHFDRYMAQRNIITKSLCEDLILHDQVLIPTTDYLTAIGILNIIGETSFIALLEQQRIKFIRTRCIFGFVRGKERDGGLATVYDPHNKRPQDCSMENSIAAALTVLPTKAKEAKKISDLIAQVSICEETSEIMKQVTHETIQDFKKSVFWRSSYEMPQENLVALPGITKMQVRVAGAQYDVKTQSIDALLALVIHNTDLLLAQKHGCIALSPSAPIGDLIDIKAARAGHHIKAAWELFEINGVPDLSFADLSKSDAFKSFNILINGKQANDFRSWFHSLTLYNRTEVLKEYINVINQVPLRSRTPAKVFRFITTTGLGIIPGIGTIAGAAASIIDSFVIDQLFRPPSPKFFIDDLNKVAGVLTKIRN